MSTKKINLGDSAVVSLVRTPGVASSQLPEHKKTTNIWSAITRMVDRGFITREVPGKLYVTPAGIAHAFRCDPTLTREEGDLAFDAGVAAGVIQDELQWRDLYRNATRATVVPPPEEVLPPSQEAPKQETPKKVTKTGDDYVYVWEEGETEDGYPSEQLCFCSPLGSLIVAEVTAKNVTVYALDGTVWMTCRAFPDVAVSKKLVHDFLKLLGVRDA